MATITIKNVPSEIVKEVGNSIEYSNDLKFIGKKRIKNNIDNKIEYSDDNEVENLGKSSLVTSNSF